MWVILSLKGNVGGKDKTDANQCRTFSSDVVIDHDEVITAASGLLLCSGVISPGMWGILDFKWLVKQKEKLFCFLLDTHTSFPFFFFFYLISMMH